MYVDFEYYSQTYKGKVEEEDFLPLSLKAQALVDYYTFHRITVITQNIKFGICELIDVMDKKERNDTRNVLSEKTGSYSITYSSSTDNTKLFNQEIVNVIYKWIPSSLLYRGIDKPFPRDFERGG